MSATPSALTPDGGDLFDLGQGKLWVGFVLRSVLRNKTRALITFCLIALLTSFFALAAPKQYSTGAKMVARTDSVISGITNPNTAIRDEPPAVLAEATIKSKDNLARIVDQKQLLKTYRRNEGTFEKMKRTFFEGIFGAPSDTEQRENLISSLQTNLSVKTADNESVKQTINVDLLWGDPIEAKDIVDQVINNYLTDRRIAEVKPATAALEIAQQAKEEQDKVVAKLRVELGIPENDERVLPDSSPIKSALAIQSDFNSRLENARIQVKNTEAAYNFRYSVPTPPELPKAPLSGTLFPLIAGLIGAAIVATFVTTATDILRGRVVESWQVSRRMNLPLLAEIRE